MTENKVRIPDAVLSEVRAFCTSASPYDYTVSDEEFDTYDDHGPGHFKGVVVSVQEKEKYQQGLAECKDLGLDPLLEEGLALRLRVSGRRENDAYRRLVSEARTRQIKIDEAQEILESYRSVIEGFDDVGADEYSGQWWTRNPDLPLLFKGRVPREGREIKDSDVYLEIYRLPNGDLFKKINYNSWARLTKDQELFADKMRRKSIKGHVYHEPLRSAVVEAVRNDALVLGYCVYMNISKKSTFPIDGIDSNCSGMNCRTAEEEVQSLRDFIGEAMELQEKWGNPEKVKQLEELLPLVVDGSITEWDGEQ